MRELKDVEYCPGYAADVYLPEENGFDTIVYFHGGGMTEGSKNGENIVDIARFFAGNGYCVVCALSRRQVSRISRAMRRGCRVCTKRSAEKRRQRQNNSYGSVGGRVDFAYVVL